MKTYAVTIEAEVKPGDINAIAGGLQAFNASHTGGAVPKYIVVSLKDQAHGESVGGLVGGTYLGWLHIQAVWLPEACRGQGYGAMLMSMVQEEALRMNCTHAFLETLSFQALGFYEKLGYVVASKIPDFPPGGAKYALTKRLAVGGSLTKT